MGQRVILREEDNRLPERLLLERAAAGDPQAYEILYTRYFPKLYHYIYRFTQLPGDDIIDICQDLFLKLWDRKELLLSVESLDFYLKRASRNALLDWLKHGTFRKGLHVAYSSLREEHRATTEEDLQFTEYNHLAKMAIDRLSPRKQQIFRMRLEQDLSLDEIAERLQISKSRVKQSIYEARDEVRIFLKNHGGLCLMLFLLNL